jgi:hypothetical protein
VISLRGNMKLGLWTSYCATWLGNKIIRTNKTYYYYYYYYYYYHYHHHHHHGGQ